MIISLVAQKGGVGKSTVAVAIAWELQARGSRVLLVDADPQGTVRITGEVAAESGTPAPTIVALGKDMHRPEQLPQLARNFDHVVIDTPGESGEIQRSALMCSDLVLMPGGDSAPDAWGVTATIVLIQQAQSLRPDLKAAVVITRRTPKTVLGKRVREVFEGCGLPVLTADTTFRVAWKESLAAGKGVAQHAPRDAAAKELRALVTEILAFGAKAHLNEVANG